MKTPGVDTIVAQQDVANTFNEILIPLTANFVLNFIFPTIPLFIIFCTQFLSIILVIFLTFVHWKKGSKCWLRISPILFFVFLIALYIILPAIALCCVAYSCITKKLVEEFEFIYIFLVFLAVINIMRIVQFASNIRKTILLESRIYLQCKGELEELGEEDLRWKLLKSIEESQTQRRVYLKIPVIKTFLDKKLPYVEKSRGFGTGELRIGTSLEFEKDIFSLVFCS